MSITTMIPIQRASSELVLALIKIGAIYLGEDYQLHANDKYPQEHEKNILGAKNNKVI